MSRIARFVIWICSKFNRQEIEQIIEGLLDVLTNRNPEIKPKDNFKEQHPNYRNFYVDSNPPLTEQPEPAKPIPTKDFNLLLYEYQDKKGKPLAPVKTRPNSQQVPENITCHHCNAPHIYLYYNNGQKRTQLKCKVCNNPFSIEHTKKSGAKYFCPYCLLALFKWKEREEVTIYKCSNDACPHRLKALNNLNSLEQSERDKRSSQFKLCYQYRDYHFKPQQLTLPQPHKPRVQLSKIYNSQNILGLILTFYVSFALSARTTSRILNSVFNVDVSYQTVLNYAQTAAYHCHQFNLQNKGSIDDISAGDETYIKIKGKQHYVFFFICSGSRKISAYHIADNRGTLPATITMNEAIRTAKAGQKIVLITDGNPSYPAGIHFINSNSPDNSLEHHKVIGLQNLDQESEDFRPFKQLIERLNRTFKHHVKPSYGFNSSNGALSLTTLFVTYYNFLRPHYSLYGRTPIHLPLLNNISTIQGKWAKILSLSSCN